MAIDTVSDARIQSLLSSRKTLANPNAAMQDKGTHLQQNFDVENDVGEKMTLYLRQNKLVKDDFSCGLIWNSSGGQKLTLVRYNGSSHPHPNKIEGDRVEFECHIHTATERYIQANLKPEGYAEVTNRYSDLNGAVQCLLSDCNIDGFGGPAPQINLPLTP